MTSRNHQNLSIIEAVETLSNIADLDITRDAVIAHQQDILLDTKNESYPTVHWLHDEEGFPTVNLIKDTFKVILHYLKNFYKTEYSYLTDQKAIDGIKTIMVLVGEAAKKLDKYTQVFEKNRRQISITSCKEYKQLQEFYLSKIARQIDEKQLGRWILGLSLGLREKEKELELKAAPSHHEVTLQDCSHVFVDLEAVKKDAEYELFFIRKEDGTRFFSPRLLRNVKLLSNFGEYFGDRKKIDPIEDLPLWRDRYIQSLAKDLVNTSSSSIQKFFQIKRKIHDNEIMPIAGKAVMALMLSSHTNNLLHHEPSKSCSEYFTDFQGFLREILNAKTFQKWLAYPSSEYSDSRSIIMEMIQTICRNLYLHLNPYGERFTMIKEMIHRSHQSETIESASEQYRRNQISQRLAEDHTGMIKLMKGHPNGPLNKVLEILDEDSFHTFNPIRQQNLPGHLYDLHLSEHSIELIALAAPIEQQFIHKASVDEEFKTFLRSLESEQGLKRHLLFNLQDGTSWSEYARWKTLQDLSHHDAYKQVLSIVSLAIDTDFYNQVDPYHHLNHANVFKQQFRDHLFGENSGYHFPTELSVKELKCFYDDSFDAIHQVFFSGKNVIVREGRLDFIELFYLLLQLKIIEKLSPNSFSFTCKDGVDIGASFNVEMFAFLKILNQSEWSTSDWDLMNNMIYGPAMIIRERLMLPERFRRLLNIIKCIENTKEEFGKEVFAAKLKEKIFPLFDSDIIKTIPTYTQHSST